MPLHSAADPSPPTALLLLEILPDIPRRRALSAGRLDAELAVPTCECYRAGVRRRVIERIRDAVRGRHYDVTKHAADEMAEDGIDIVDAETAILNGRIVKTEKDDPRGERYTVHGVAADGATPTGSVGRFTETGRYLIITAYVVTDE
jgi:hypothetical protein